MPTHDAVRCANPIPDYLIYDEMKRRRIERPVQERLEMPLYRPGKPVTPPPPPVSPPQAPTTEWIWGDEPIVPPGDRGVHIIDMVDMGEESEIDDP